MKNKSNINFWNAAINRVCDLVEKSSDNNQREKLLRLGKLFSKYCIEEMKGRENAR